METIYTIAALWLGLAVFSAIIAHHLRISIALVEICIGVVAANIIGHFFGPDLFGSNLEWLRFLASTGAIMLTFLAGAELDPKVMRLKWREVVGANAVIGTVNDKNRKVLIFPDNLYSLNRGPYVEATVGIENILKVFRFDGVYRLTYLDNPRVTPFSIRFSMQFTF